LKHHHPSFFGGGPCRACQRKPADTGTGFCFWCQGKIRQADLTALNRESLHNDMRRAGIPLSATKTHHP
jgi:hypothetical protein